MGVTPLLERPFFSAWKYVYSRDSRAELAELADASADQMTCRSSEYQHKHLC